MTFGKGVTTFLITVQKHDVDKVREDIRKLGYVFVEEDWTPKRTHNPVRKTKRMVKQLENKLIWAFTTTAENYRYLVGE